MKIAILMKEWEDFNYIASPDSDKEMKEYENHFRITFQNGAVSSWRDQEGDELSICEGANLIFFHSQGINYPDEGITEEIKRYLRRQLKSAGLEPAENIIPFTRGYSPWGDEILEGAIKYARGKMTREAFMKKVNKLRERYNLWV